MTSRQRTAVTLALASVGGVLLVATVRRVGWADVQTSLAALGWWFLPVLAFGGLRFAARARAWMTCARHQGLAFGNALSATLAGDALGNLTPLGLLASEPAKVFFVRDRVPTVTAVSSVAAENAFYVLSVLVVIGLGALAFFGRADVPPALQTGVPLVLASVMAGGLVAFWVARRRPALLTRLASIGVAVTGRGITSVERLRDVETQFYALLSWPAERLWRVACWEALFHVAAVAEVFLILRLLPSGAAVTLVEAFILETAGRLIVVVFRFVPYRLGVDEAGSALVARALLLDPAAGVTLALVRRLRILCWNGVGILLLLLKRHRTGEEAIVAPEQPLH